MRFLIFVARSIGCLSGFPGLRYGCVGLPEHVSAQVVDDVCQADFGLCPGDPDGSDEEVHVVLLVGKDMLDAGTWP